MYCTLGWKSHDLWKSYKINELMNELHHRQENHSEIGVTVALVLVVAGERQQVEVGCRWSP